ncbi:MAG: hypothetical protein LBQ45_02280 [Mycoplasmataceae bacterium]|nr:hypothetical protein [Mycoplasmataceae bacterium]
MLEKNKHNFTFFLFYNSLCMTNKNLLKTLLPITSIALIGGGLQPLLY